MEENTSINGKVIGMVVAVIVLATVLVPICNAFANSGDGGNADPLEPIQGNRVSEFDVSNESNTGTTYYDDTLDLNQPLTFSMPTVLDNSSRFSKEVDKGNWITTDVEQTIKCTSKSTTYSKWVVGEGTGQVTHWVYPGERFFVYDVDGEYIVQERGLTDDNKATIKLSPTELRNMAYANYWLDIYFDECGLDFTLNMVYSESQGWMYNWELDFGTIVSKPNVYFASDGTLTFDGNLVLFDEDQTYEYNISEIAHDRPTYWLMLHYYALYHIPSEDSGSNNSDSGIAGTLIGIIPVFVAVGLLGVMAIALINRNRTE